MFGGLPLRRTATRLYGSPLRRTLSPLADAVAEWAIRHADAVRTLSPQTTRQVRDRAEDLTRDLVEGDLVELLVGTLFLFQRGFQQFHHIGPEKSELEEYIRQNAVPL